MVRQQYVIFGCTALNVLTLVLVTALLAYDKTYPTSSYANHTFLSSIWTSEHSGFFTPMYQYESQDHVHFATDTVAYVNKKTVLFKYHSRIHKNTLQNTLSLDHNHDVLNATYDNASNALTIHLKTPIHFPSTKVLIFASRFWALNVDDTWTVGHHAVVTDFSDDNTLRLIIGRRATLPDIFVDLQLKYQSDSAEKSNMTKMLNGTSPPPTSPPPSPIPSSYRRLGWAGWWDERISKVKEDIHLLKDLIKMAPEAIKQVTKVTSALIGHPEKWSYRHSGFNETREEVFANISNVASCDGSLSANLGFFIELNIVNREPVYFETGISDDFVMGANCHVTGETNMSFHHNFTKTPIVLGGPVEFHVGPLPVSISLAAGLSIHGAINVNGDIQFGSNVSYDKPMSVKYTKEAKKQGEWWFSYPSLDDFAHSLHPVYVGAQVTASADLSFVPSLYIQFNHLGNINMQVIPSVMLMLDSKMNDAVRVNVTDIGELDVSNLNSELFGVDVKAMVSANVGSEIDLGISGFELKHTFGPENLFTQIVFQQAYGNP